MTMYSSRAKRSNQGVLSALADAALDRFRLIFPGTDDDHVGYQSAASDRPLGVVLNGCGAAEDAVAYELLGHGESKVVKAGSDATGSKGDRIVCQLPATEATGTVRALPATAGTYWVIGTAREAFAADQEFAIDDCEPYQVVVIATIAAPAAATAAAPAVTYAAPSGGATQDAEARASLAQAAVDLVAVRAEMAKELTDIADLRTKLASAIAALKTAGVIKSS